MTLTKQGQQAEVPIGYKIYLKEHYFGLLKGNWRAI